MNYDYELLLLYVDYLNHSNHHTTVNQRIIRNHQKQRNNKTNKVNDQISSFMIMMQTLEVEWQKGEEARIKREEELDQQRKMLETAGEQMAFLAKTMADVTAKIDHMKLLLDRLVDNTPKAAKKVCFNLSTVILRFFVLLFVLL